MIYSWVVYCENKTGTVGFSEKFKYRVLAQLYYWEKKRQGFTVRLAKESADMID